MASDLGVSAKNENAVEMTLNRQTALSRDDAIDSGELDAANGDSPFNKVTSIASAISRFLEGRVNPLTIELDDVLSATEAVIQGRPTILFGTNNYLGLNFDPDCRAAAAQALEKHGTGTTASRVASGSYSGHVALEREIAEVLGRRSAIVFSTGFQANLGVISGLAGPGDYILIDRDCHASIYDGCKLSGAEVVEFKHNDADHLAERIEELGVPGHRIIIVVEGLYSVGGDVATLKDFVEVKKRFGAYLLVDEAHSFGTCGPNGRGEAEAQGVEDDVDIVIGTFSKSVGVIGGFAVSDHPAFNDLRLLARSYLYTASLPPPVVAAARTSIQKIAKGAHLRDRLRHNANRLHAALREIGYELLAEPGPVIGIKAPGFVKGYNIWHRLLESGLYVNFLIPPSTPGGSIVLRCSLSAEHSDEQIDAAIKAFSDCWRHVMMNGSSPRASVG